MLWILLKKPTRKMAELKSSNEDLLNEARAERDAMMKDARGIKDGIIAEAKEKAKEGC